MVSSYQVVSPPAEPEPVLPALCLPRSRGRSRTLRVRHGPRARAIQRAVPMRTVDQDGRRGSRVAGGRWLRRDVAGPEPSAARTTPTRVTRIVTIEIVSVNTGAGFDAEPQFRRADAAPGSHLDRPSIDGGAAVEARITSSVGSRVRVGSARCAMRSRRARPAACPSS